MQYKNITIILGAGSSKAYAQYPYPLLMDLLTEILNSADKMPGIGGRQRLHLATALSKAYGIEVKELETDDVIREEVIQEKYEKVKLFFKSKNTKECITDLFNNIERLSNDHSTKAYWALCNSIGIYMWQMAQWAMSNYGRRDIAHKKLTGLIDKLLLDGCVVSVIDFNYDCVLEYEKRGCGTNVSFNWNCGRDRVVIADTSMNDKRTPSELVAAKCFRKPWDSEENYKTSAILIKPHGDFCTFLLGDQEIYYRGGRHSQTTTAIFPEQLGDISPKDNFLRSSILPPTNSRFRHESIFYDEEIKRMQSSLNNCEAVLIIGWSANGTDSFYKDIFAIALENKPSGPDIYIIDKSSKEEIKNTANRVCDLFNNKTKIKNININGFDEEAVRVLEGLFED